MRSTSMGRSRSIRTSCCGITRGARVTRLRRAPLGLRDSVAHIPAAVLASRACGARRSGFATSSLTFLAYSGCLLPHLPLYRKKTRKSLNTGRFFESLNISIANNYGRRQCAHSVYLCKNMRISSISPSSSWSIGTSWAVSISYYSY